MRQILIVDDDVDFREGLQMVLSDVYDTVLMAANDPAAADLALALVPDAVLIDPEPVGLETAARIKDHNPQVRVVLLSVFDRYRTQAAAAHADGYLLKGCPVEELLAALGP